MTRHVLNLDISRSGNNALRRMNPDEYANLAALEQKHWYYAGKRATVAHWLRSTSVITPDKLLLDCGAGTGLFAKEMEQSCRVLVLDDHEQALRILHTRFRADQVISLAGDNIPLSDRSVDFVTALDVLEHVPDDDAVVRSFQRILKQGGLAVVTVPASMALWSDWDVALHHHRRYDRRQLERLFSPTDWEVIHVNYTNTAPYPIVWLIRKWRQAFSPKPEHAKRSDRSRFEDRTPPAPLNSILKWLFVTMGKSRLRMPIGVSLILVARRL
jgi:2-polyprenyl-3-methyl-5-hydroxy-6-metoxy-1,4-benzoquinol methylase